MPYVFQRIVAAAALLLLSPILAMVALMILISDGAPVVYSGKRYGRGREPFQQFKFRTMVNNADSLLVDGRIDPTINRVTRLGSLLRRTSLDELPQLVNIVRGDMAFVGPRPLIAMVFERVDPDHERFTVLPGITGLAQVNGRNFLPWSQRLVLDAEYVQARSIRQDVGLLVKTVKVTLTAADIAPDRNPGAVLDI